MKTKSIAILLLFLVVIHSHCKKAIQKADPKPCEHQDQLCDSAMHSLGNFTHDTITYSWSFDERDTFLLPGQIHTRKMGHVEVKYERGTCEKKRISWSTATISTNHGVWAIQLDHCNKKSNFRYDRDEPSSGIILLYNDTE